MRFAIVYSKLNQAGKTIVEEMKKLAFTPQFPIIELANETLYENNLNSKKYPELRNIDLIIFASTHRSEKGKPSLSLHAPGNWRNADLGGNPGKISNTSAFVMKYLFQNLYRLYEQDKSKLSKEYAITLEVTHHGPSIDIPCCYIELGSTENEWGDREAAKIIAKTILTLQNYKGNFIANHPWVAAIGIGGPHYAPNFNKIQLNSQYAIGHIIPEYALPLTESMLKEAEQKTKENMVEVLIDWKGCGKSEQRQDIITIIEKLGFKYKRTNAVEKE
ncbi:MAG: D-aminoacyl-tRNA deacylase [Candidatus Nanoarchaeia archaeon]|nr:D-aminoacyl-tRNA deacylase [Candidatus Nanoarchaeia archaeon]